MPLYAYRCGACHSEWEQYRPFDQMDAPAACETCGGPLDRIFAPSTNIYIPIHMRSVLTGGRTSGGGGLTWSDFHGDTTERELAADPRVVPAAQHNSQAGIIKRR